MKQQHHLGICVAEQSSCFWKWWSTYHHCQLLIKVNDVGNGCCVGEKRGCGKTIIESFRHEDWDWLKFASRQNNWKITKCLQANGGTDKQQADGRLLFHSCGAWNIIESKPHWSDCNRNWVININIKQIPSFWLLHSVAEWKGERKDESVREEMRWTFVFLHSNQDNFLSYVTLW